ncbi:hypothetical protein L1987_86978 [Smallanthus sonchifolius]|uniref:Uncharacterized protein n=1 Tax=Smallanthus sonchifolius TaxID=185202 RepID=A0ACB8Y0W0_9ASTR|nr:hypothetical protein L1987_86978 [Smallanthus sonchifolius]
MKKTLCTKCHSKKYCLACITKWYYLKYCAQNDKLCLSVCLLGTQMYHNRSLLKHVPFVAVTAIAKHACVDFHLKLEGYSCSQPDKIKYSKQILQKVFPLVTTLNEDQLMEKEIEAKVKGVSISELQLQDADCEVDDDIFCDNCGSYSFDFYRSCGCGYDLCLVCCRELRDGQLKGMTCGWKARIDGSIPCPPKDIGGCNDGTLDLKRIMSVNWIVNVLEKSQGLYKVNNNSYDNPQTSMESSGSYLYSLSAKDIQPQHIQHFQLHWSKGEPIIVNDVLSTSSGLSWEPMVLWLAFRDIASNHSHAYEVNAINCFDWSEVTVDLSKFCKEYSTGQVKKQGLPLLLKLEDWQPFCLSQGEWPRHFVEFINCLPFKDYTNPNNGYLNVAVKLPYLSAKPNMGPKMDIVYGVEKELEYGDSITKLHYEKSDTVNVLTHTKSNVLTSTKLNKTKVVKQKHGDQHEPLVCEAGPQRNEGQQYAVEPMEGSALWDIFHRKDVPKLEEYLRNHSTEFSHTDRFSVEQVFHPIHDRTFYLNMEHKRKLKEEFGIEPWTLKQNLGDAIFIPAGCPYQVRNLKIGKMMIYALDHAVTELSGFIDSNRHTDGLQDQFAMAPQILNAGDDMNINNHTNGWVCDSESDDNSQDTSGLFLALSPSVNHTVDNQPAAIEDSDTSEEPVGLWHGNDVGRAAKEILQAVEHRYPDTFQGVEIRPKPHWVSLLKEFHLFIKGFLETSVDALAKDQITSLEADLNDFEKFGFDLSWAHKRLDMVKNLKFGNDPLRLERVVLEESLKALHKELVEANARLEKARLDYDRATDARNKKVDEVAQKFGAEYDDVLNGNLGFGMLPGN